MEEGKSGLTGSPEEEGEGLFTRGRKFLQHIGSFLDLNGATKDDTTQHWATVSRAECVAILALAENAAKGEAVRLQSLVIAERKLDHERAFRANGQRLKAARRYGQERVKDAIDDRREAKAFVGSEIREELEIQRLRRANWQHQWELHGRQLHREHKEKQQKMRDAEAKQQATSRDECRVMSEELKQLTKATREDIERQKDEQAADVRSRSNGDLYAKQLFANERYHSAAAVKHEVKQWKQRTYDHEIEYLANALEAKRASQTSIAEAQAQWQAKCAADAAECRLERERLKEEGKSAKHFELERKRAVVQTVQAAKRTPAAALEEQLTMALNEEGALDSVSRYFGFRRRGANQVLSSCSVASTTTSPVRL